MPRENDKDNEQLPEEEPTDEAEESADGAPSGVGRVWNAAGRAVGATASAAGSVVDATTSAAGKAAEATASAAGNTLDVVTSAPKVALNKVFPECPVPAFMLPTGPDVEDYEFVFQIEEMLDNLRSGVFVRPKIEIWAARDSGYDVEHFIEELEHDFVRQFSEAREELQKAGEAQIEKVALERERASGKLRNEATGLAINAAAGWSLAIVAGSFIPFVSGPQAMLVGPLLLLWLGLRPKTKIIGLLKEYFSVTGEKNQIESELQGELDELKARLNSKDKALQRAVKRLEVKIHPRIQEIARLICEAEGVAFSPAVPEQDSDDVPDVEPYLSHPMYLERLPERYRRLLNAKQD